MPAGDVQNGKPKPKSSPGCERQVGVGALRHVNERAPLEARRTRNAIPEVQRTCGVAENSSQ